MRWLFALLCFSVLYGDESEIELFLRDFPSSYQDIVVHNETIQVGTNICSPRYELIKTVLNSYEGRSFSVLDIGAAQGYFDFKIAHEYPLSHCTMIEANNKRYPLHANKLFRLCKINRYLSNVTFLDKILHLEDLQYLNHYEHFDVVFAFLVAQQFLPHEQNAMIEEILKLGDQVIIEVAPDHPAPHVNHLAKKLHAHYLGELPRYYGKTNVGEFYWFEKPAQTANTHTILQKTFTKLNGIWPEPP